MGSKLSQSEIDDVFKSLLSRKLLVTWEDRFKKVLVGNLPTWSNYTHFMSQARCQAVVSILEWAKTADPDKIEQMQEVFNGLISEAFKQDAGLPGVDVCGGKPDIVKELTSVQPMSKPVEKGIFKWVHDHPSEPSVRERMGSIAYEAARNLEITSRRDSITELLKQHRDSVIGDLFHPKWLECPVSWNEYEEMAGVTQGFGSDTSIDRGDSSLYVWYFESDMFSWASLSGRAGFVLLRTGPESCKVVSVHILEMS